MNFSPEQLDRLTLKELTTDDLDKKYYKALNADFPVTEIRNLTSVKAYVRQGMYFCYELYLKEEEETETETETETKDTEEVNQSSKGLKDLNGLKGSKGKDQEESANGKYIGYAYFLKDPLSGWMLLDYLGVKEELRGMGYGSMFLTKVLKELGRENYVFIEVEAAEFLPFKPFDSHRQKRLDFYIKNGLLDTGVVTETYTVFYSILVYKEGVGLEDIPSKEDIGRLYLNLYRYIVGTEVCRKYVRVAYPEITVDSIDD